MAMFSSKTTTPMLAPQDQATYSSGEHQCSPSTPNNINVSNSNSRSQLFHLPPHPNQTSMQAQTFHFQSNFTGPGNDRAQSCHAPIVPATNLNTYSNSHSQAKAGQDSLANEHYPLHEQQRQHALQLHQHQHQQHQQVEHSMYEHHHVQHFSHSSLTPHIQLQYGSFYQKQGSDYSTIMTDNGSKHKRSNVHPLSQSFVNLKPYEQQQQHSNTGFESN
ncbi:hypothetical protein BX616_004652, partial [Lobosporangium transversale]